MSAADDPKPQDQTKSTAVTGTPPAASSSAVTGTPHASVSSPPAPKRPKKARMSAEEFAKMVDRLDLALVALLLLGAFLTAAFSVRNSDFFQHLAVGRLIAQGQYEIGKDPFTFTTENVRWVNHSWLYSYVLHLLYSTGEAAGYVLIGLKALAIMALAGILLVLSRHPGQRWLIPAVCTTTAILALSSRLLLQPVVVSYLFLGLTMLLIRWPHLQAPADPRAARSYRCFWLLPPLFALWVNCDQWFFLGPVAAGLYWLGEYVQDFLSTEKQQHRDPKELRTLGYAVLAGVAACLLNPHHIFAFTLPAQLGIGDAAAAVKQDEQLRTLFVSPLDGDFWSATYGLSATGIAYCVLMAAGVVSFVLSYQSLRWQRVLLFVVLGALSLYHARAIPFFAVIAGPITALNFLDYAARMLGGEIEPDRHREYWALGRSAALLAVVAFVVCSIPGWTQPHPYETRHLGWQILPDPSLVKTCEQINAWRRDGLLEPDARWFNTSPEIVNYMAWYCPGERGFLDLRLALFDENAKDYVDARADLVGRNIEFNNQTGQVKWTKGEWQRVFKDRKIHYAILYMPNANRMTPPLMLLLNNSSEWTPYHLDGHTLVFGWNQRATDHDDPTRNQRLKFDLTAEAFGPNAVKAPRTPPARAAVRHEWFMALWETPPQRQQAVNDAVAYCRYEEFQWERWNLLRAHELSKLQLATQLAAKRGMAVKALTLDRRSPYYVNVNVLNVEPPTPATLYVALRNLRQSLHVNPDDPQAYLRLGQVYMTLFWNSPEVQRSSAAGYPHLALIRQAQFTAAVHRALQLDPDLEEAHALLAQWYRLCQERGVACYLDSGFSTVYVDMELKHKKEQLRILRERLGSSDTTDASTAPSPEGAAAGPDPKTNPDAARLKKLEQDIQSLNVDVRKRLDQFEISAKDKPPVQRAQSAIGLGLADEALAVLEKATADEMASAKGAQANATGRVVLVKLLLSTGQLDKAYEVLKRHEADPWGTLPEFRVLSYDWFRLLYMTAIGDYDEADLSIDAMHKFTLTDESRLEILRQYSMVRSTGRKVGVPETHEVAGLMVGQIMLNEVPFGNRLVRPGPTLAQTYNVTIDLFQREADYVTLRGWLALEAGDISAARKHLRAALVPASSSERNLALTAAIGVAVPVEPLRNRHGTPTGNILTLRSTGLANMGLSYLDAEAAHRR